MDTSHWAREIRGCRKRWFRLDARGDAPTPRCSHTATLVGPRLLIIGGGACAGRGEEEEEEEGEEAAAPPAFVHFSDVVALDVRTLAWACVLDDARAAERGAVFAARRGHSAVLHAATQRVVVFGGTDGGTQEEGCRSDVCCLHCTAPERWELPRTRGAAPSPRRGHRAVVSGDVMLVVGGYVRSLQEARLLHLLDLDGWAWHSVQCGGDFAPHYGLALFGCTLLGHTLHCFGGHQYFSPSSHSNRLWTLDVAPALAGLQGGERGPDGQVHLEWREEHCAGRPPSARFCMECVEAWGNLVVFGGSGAGVALNDTHILHRRAAAAPAGEGSPSSARPEWFPADLAPPPAAATAGDGETMQVGDRVWLHGLVSRPELNGASGVLKLFHGESGRWVVRVGDEDEEEAEEQGETVRVRPCNLQREQAPPTAPEVRNAMTMTRVGNRFVVFGGGVFPTQYYNDTWCFELDLQPVLPSASPYQSACLVPHLASMVGSAEFADVQFELDDGLAAVPAHRLLLCSGESGYFRSLLRGGFQESAPSGSTPMCLRLPADIARGTLLDVLKFLYTGEFLVQDPEQLLRTLSAADVLGMETLRRVCEAQLAAWVDEGQVLEILLVARAMNCDALQALCMNFLQQRFGSWSQGGGRLQDVSGFDRLDDDLRQEVAWNLGQAL